MLNATLIKTGKTLALAAGLGLAALAAPAFAGGEHCKDVYVQVTNKTGGEVKIIDLDYYDFGAGKWRSEPTKNRTIGAGQSWSFKKRLENVGGEMTQVRIEYRVKERRLLSKWSKVRSKDSGRSVCYRGSEYRVTLR